MNISPSKDSSRPKRRGSWTHRLLIFIFSCLLAVLVYWLLGFIMKDIERLPVPDRAAINAEYIPQALSERQEQLEKEAQSVRRDIERMQEEQGLIKSSLDNLQTTIDHLVNLQKGVALSEAEQQALRRDRQLLLTRQKEYQDLIANITREREKKESLEDEQDQIWAEIIEKQAVAAEEYDRRLYRHDLIIAAAKLAILIPLALLILWGFFRLRSSVYRPMVLAPGFAVFAKIAIVMHQYFPSQLFKYVLVFIAIAAVMKFLFYLLRLIVAPKLDWLLKQNREGYERFLCPTCSYPIRRGPLKYLFWTSRSIKKLQVPPATEMMKDEPYICPFCATKLYEKCASCGGIRASLLPACEHCGAEKQLGSSPT